MPRIRNGLSLSSANATLTHYINLETISCEAIKKETDKTFDSLDWFLIDSQQSLSSDKYKLQRINKTILNYTSVFPATSGLVNNNTYYRCCTLLNNTIKNCQQFLAVIHNNPNGGVNLLDLPYQEFITTRKVLHLSKKTTLKQQEKEKSALALGSKLNKENDLISSTTSFRILKETGGESDIYNTQPSANKMRTATVCCDTNNVAAAGGSGSGGGKI